MKVSIKHIKYKNDQIMDLIIPVDIPKQLSGIDFLDGEKIIIGDRSAFKFMKQVFLIAANLLTNQIIYIPTSRLKVNEFTDDYNIPVSDLSIIIVNYHSTQLKDKELYYLINKKEEIEEKNIKFQLEKYDYPDDWLTKDKLYTKRYKKLLIISSNKDVYTKFAYDLEILCEDEEIYYNFDHVHENFKDTSKYHGLIFSYYYRNENE